MGTRRWIGVRTIGKQAQTIAVLASIVVHIVLFSVPNVGSGAFEATSKVVILKILVANTNPPKPNTTVSPHFCRLGNLNFQITGGTEPKMMTSVTMLKMAFAYQNAVTLIQVPGSFLFQKRGMGVHWKIVAMMEHTA